MKIKNFTVYGAITYYSQQFFYMTCDTTNKENLMNFMEMLLTSNLKLHKSIMVLDNHRAHTSKDF